MNRTPFRLRALVLTAILFALLALSGKTQVAGQSPPDDLQLAPPAMLPPFSIVPEPVDPKPDPEAAEKIQQALQGRTPTEIPPTVLGDVIGIIRKQGSVLDGSSLDPRLADDDLLLPAAGNRNVPLAQPIRQRVQTAETLLHAARMLESISGDLRPRASETLPASELIRQMRIQATRLLLNEFPEAIQ